MMQKLSHFLTLMLLLLGGVGLTSCELFSDNPISPNLRVKTSAITVKVGQTKRCNVSASTKAKLLYASSDETIATVDQNGLVTGVAKGTAYITVIATNADNSALFFDESAIITVTVVEEGDDVGPSEEEEKAEAVKLLSDALKDGALVSMNFNLDDKVYAAFFQLVAGKYVLQESASSSGGLISWSNKGTVKASLQLVDVSSTGADSSTLLSFTIADETTGKTIMQCLVDTQNASYAVVSEERCAFRGMEVAAKPLTLTKETLEEIFGDTPVRVTDDGTIEVWDGNQWVDPTKKAGTISYAVTSIGKTFGDANFINELTLTGDGKVSYQSSNTAVATVNSETGEVTIKGNGETTIKATVEDTDNYAYATKEASYTLGVGTATMTVSAEGYTGFYDGSAHGITVTAPTGATIKYGTAAGTYDKTASPTYTDAGNYTVYYEVTKTGYTTVTGSATVTINKADISVTATGYAGTYDAAAHGIKVDVTSPSGATIKYGTTAGSYTQTNCPTYTNVGTYIVYYQVSKDNYNSVAGSATVEITKADMTVTAKGYNGVYDGLAHSITVTAPSDATIKYGTSADNCTETSLSYKEVGTYTIFYEVTKDNYNTVTGSATVVITLSTMTVTADGYSGTYDGQPHGITVTAPTYASVRYGETEGTYDKTSSPTYTNAGTYTVYYQVKKVGYTTVTGSATVVINKAAGTVSFSTDTVEKLNSDSAFKEEATLTGDGTISGYSSSVPGVATVAADGTVTIISTGTTVITATVTDGTNYKYSPNTATYTLTVKAGGLNAPASYGTGTNPF